MPMLHYMSDSRVAVYPFVRHPEGDEIVISRPDTASVLVLPPDGVEILDCLATGMSIGETRAYYQDKYNEVPDLDDFLQILEDTGFILPLDSDKIIDPAATKLLFTNNTTAQKSSRSFHFAHFPETLAQHLCSKNTLYFCLLLISLAGIAIVIDPSIVPGRQSMIFTEHITLMNLSVMSIVLAGVFLHEMAHLIAARSFGIASRLGIGHRMWILVVETDMTGVWVVPKHKRYIPFLAGPLVDLTMTSLLLMLMFAVNREWFALSTTSIQVLRAAIFVYFLTILWQCYFFVRTDIYYVIANYFGCKNLMGDAVDLLQNYIAKLFRWWPSIEQSHIPSQERRVIRVYAWFWLFGRIVALSVFVLIVVPLLYDYAVIIGQTLQAGYQTDPYGFIDALFIGAVVLGFQGFGIFLWIRSVYQSWRHSHVFTAKTPRSTPVR